MRNTGCCNQTRTLLLQRIHELVHIGYVVSNRAVANDVILFIVECNRGDMGIKDTTVIAF